MAWLLSSASVASAGAGRQFLRRHVPSAVADAVPVDRLPAAKHLDISIGLPFRNREALTNLLADIYDPASANYHHYLTPEQFAARFGPTEEDYQALVQFVTANGLTVRTTRANRMLLGVSGSVADIERVLHVNLRTYRHPTEQRTFFAPDAEPSLDFTVSVLDVTGLDDFTVPRPLNKKRAVASLAADATPFFGSGPSGLYIGNDFRAAYVPGVTQTGSNQVVALVEFDGYNLSDITSYESLAGLPNVPLQNILVNNFGGVAGVNNVEVALDIDMAISMAPGLSKVMVYEGAIPNEVLSQIQVDNQAAQISASWSFSINASTEQIFQMYIAQGQTYLNASGDSGAYTGTVSTPTDDPNVTSVGGTTLLTTGPGGSYVSETVWNWFGTGQGSAASSGGVSTVYAIPSWQQGVDMSSNQGSTSRRNLPDVALTGDHIYVIADGGTPYSIGGTSAATPLWAGFIALANQRAAELGQPPVGFINPALYAIAKSPLYASTFHDITTGNNTNGSTSTKFFAGPGYDLCTGWGTPKGSNLINALVQPITFTENFDGVTAPALPAGWTTTATGAESAWTTSTASANTALNAAFVPEPAAVGLSELVSPSILISSPTAKLFFWNNYNLQSSGSSSARDGGVLEIKIGNGAFTDILTAGGNFASGGYNRTVSTTRSNPLGGRQSWSGNSGGFIATSVDLPAAAAGQSIQLKWRCGTDNSTGGVGWFIDTVSIADTVGSADVAVSQITSTNPAVTGQNLAYTITITNIGPSAVSSVTVTDALPAGVALISAPAGATVLGGNVVFTVGTLASGGATNATVTVSPTNAGLITNIVSAGATVADPTPGNNLSSLVTTVNSPAVITSQPTNRTVLAGATVNFQVAATGTPVPGYQWFFNGTNLPGANSSTLTLTNVQPSQTGGYMAVISNVVGATNSVTATLTVQVPPAITLQPTNRTVLAGTNVSFQIAAVGSPLPVVQWLFNGTNVSGANANSLTLTNVQAGQAGDYTVIVTNSAGTTNSVAAHLTVLVPPVAGNIVVAGTNVTINVATLVGLNYTLEYKNLLTDANWTPLVPTVPGTGAVIGLQDTNAPAAERFYRVRAE